LIGYAITQCTRVNKTFVVMDSFFQAVGGTFAIIAIFVVAILGGQLFSAIVIKNKGARRPAGAILAVLIFVALFFINRAYRSEA
jgi:anaerobic C4-dicarboxylate transporter